MKTTTTILLLAMTAAARPFVPILARMPARLPTEFYARDADVALPELAAQAQELNTKFDGLRLADACTSGEKACVQGTSATCVGGKWNGDDCPNGMRCFGLPDLSQGAVVLTCTSKTDAKSRIDAAAQAGPAMEEAAATATADGECPDETDTGATAPSSTDNAPAPTSTAAPAGAGGADDEDCPAENDNDSNTDAGADDDSCEDDNDTDAPATPTVVPPASSTGLPVATAPSSGAPVDTAAPLPTTTDAPLPTTTPAPEPEPIETVTSVVIILPAQTLGGSATTTTLTPAEASAVLSSLGISGLHTSTTVIQPSQTGLPDATITQTGAPEATQTGAPTDGGYGGGYEYPESGSVSVTTTTSAPASTATAASDGDFITPIILPGASEGAASSATVSGAPPLVTIV